VVSLTDVAISCAEVHPPRRWNPNHPLRPPDHPVLRGALFIGLVDPPSGEPVERWVEVVDDACRLGLAPHLRRLASDVGVQLPGSADAQLRLVELNGVARSLRADASVPSLERVLASCDVRGVITKGRAIAAMDPVDAGLRTYADVDVLVTPSSFERALGALRAAGFVDVSDVQLRRSYDRRCREAVNLVHPHDGSVDLHHHVPPWIWGQRLEFASMWDAASPLTAHLRTAGPAHNALVSALHIVSDHDRAGQSLRVWRDLAVTARAAGPSLLAAAREVRLDWWLLALLEQLPPTARPAWVDDAACDVPSLSDRMRIGLLLPPSIGSRNSGVARLLRLPPTSIPVYVASYVAPSRAARERKLGDEPGYRAWWSATAQQVRADARPSRHGLAPIAGFRAGLWAARAVRSLRRNPVGDGTPLVPLPPITVKRGALGWRVGAALMRAGHRERKLLGERWAERFDVVATEATR
jgi:hypothetical protein